MSCVQKCFDFWLKYRGCKIAVSSDFVKHSSNSGLRGAVFLACSEGSFFAKCAENIVICNVFCIFEIDFVQKHWFLQHSVGVALWSPRGPDANFDECLGKSKETDAQAIAPETHSTSEIHASGNEKATFGQPPSNRQATAEQPPSNRQATKTRTPTPP